MLNNNFFDRDAKDVAIDLLGKVIRKRHGDTILSAMIIETECYYLSDKGSHASLGYTEKRKGLFMPAGTIYMYYSRGKDSFNVSCRGEGNAVLIKGGMQYADKDSLEVMHKLNPASNGSKRDDKRLCSGQTLLCKSLGLKLTEWGMKNFVNGQLYIEDICYYPKNVIQTKRLGIPAGRDEHLQYRFVDYTYANSATSNPLTKRVKNYTIINNEKSFS